MFLLQVLRFFFRFGGFTYNTARRLFCCRPKVSRHPADRSEVKIHIRKEKDNPERVEFRTGKNLAYMDTVPVCPGRCWLQPETSWTALRHGQKKDHPFRSGLEPMNYEPMLFLRCIRARFRQSTSRLSCFRPRCAIQRFALSSFRSSCSRRWWRLFRHLP